MFEFLRRLFSIPCSDDGKPRLKNPMGYQPGASIVLTCSDGGEEYVQMHRHAIFVKCKGCSALIDHSPTERLGQEPKGYRFSVKGKIHYLHRVPTGNGNPPKKP